MIVLFGWGIDSDPLRRFGIATVTMNPTSACLFLLLGLGLILRDRPQGAAEGGIFRFAGAAAIGLAGIVGALKVIDVTAGTHIDVDTLLFASKLGAGYARPSEMAPNAAICFVTMSVGLLMMGDPAERSVVNAQILALVVALISLFALVGHLFGVDSFYVVATFHPMAAHSAASFLCLAIFILRRTRRRALMAPLSDPGPSGRTSRALLPAAIAIPMVLGWLRQEGERLGLFPADVGVALMALLTMLTMVAMIWQTARLLLKADMLRRHAEARITHLADHDFLTGLPNRGAFMQKLASRAAAWACRPGDSFAIIYMDLDGFKQVNDRFGHAAGDALLRDVGGRLMGNAHRSTDFVARLGGDEFAMLLDQVGEADEAISVAARILADIPKQFGPAGNDIAIGISLGIAIASSRHCTAEQVLAEADEALYHAKRTGKGRFALHGFRDQQAGSAAVLARPAYA